MTTSAEAVEGGEVLYGAAAIAKFMGVTRRQVFHMKDKAGLPTFSIGQTVCARPAAVRAWLGACEMAQGKAKKP